MKNLSRPAPSFKWRLFVLLFLILVLKADTPSSVAQSNNVIINEIAWMGGLSSYNDEWIELYNLNDFTVNLENWALKSADGNPEITLKGGISAKGFYLLERTDDDTLSVIPADQIYVGALSNNGKQLALYDNFGNLADSIDASVGWPAGDNATKQTMERTESGGWQTSLNPGGTPKSKNSVLTQLKEKGSETEPLAQTEKSYPRSIVINEILPSPEGADAREEWIEIFNKNNFEIDFSFWQISDIIGSTTTYTFLEGTKIKPNGFLVIYRPESKITLNNDGDGLNLIQPDGKTVNSLVYEKAPKGQSYNLENSQWFWSKTLTPDNSNIVEIVPKPSEKEESKNLSLNLESSIDSKKELAAVSEPFQDAKIKETIKPLYGLFVALFVAALSGYLILILKKKIKSS